MPSAQGRRFLTGRGPAFRFTDVTIQTSLTDLDAYVPQPSAALRAAGLVAIASGNHQAAFTLAIEDAINAMLTDQRQDIAGGHVDTACAVMKAYRSAPAGPG